MAVPRMLVCLIATLVLIALTLLVRGIDPSSLLAVTFYKTHLMALGGWGGYWLDRSLFPYDRPHQYLDADSPPANASDAFGATAQPGDSVELACATNGFAQSMLRRAIIVAACLICVGLGA
jgi:Putative 2/3 transmembrane domain holin